MPWCYRNNRGEIVGLEVDMAQAMAVDLNVGLTLVPVDRLARNEALASGACDMATGRIMPSEASAMAFSHPLADERWAFLTLDHERDVYASLERIRALRAPRIAVLRVSEWIELLTLQLPNAEIVPIDSLQEFIDAPPGRFDATFTGFDRAAAYSLIHPQFSAVLPTPSLGSVPLAILVPRDETSLRDFANAVVEVARANGTLDARLAYWIRGEGIVVERRPRWSIGRDVFGWWQ
jgi:ABC-type amino acid transport substrate-binding protein